MKLAFAVKQLFANNFATIKYYSSRYFKNKKFMHHPHTMDYVPISAFLLFVVSEVARGEECAYFCHFLPQLKYLLQQSKCQHHPHTRCHLGAKFDILMPSQS